MSQEEIVVPKGWKLVTLGNMCDLDTGFAFKSDTFQTSGIPLVRIGNIQNEKVEFKASTVFLNEKSINKYQKFIVKKNDILIALSGATTGKSAIYDKDEPVFLNQRVGRIKLKKYDVNLKKYIYYFIKKIREDILEKSWGGAQPNISPKLIEKFEILIPNDEKILCKIIAKLDHVLGELEVKKKEILSLIEQNKQRIDFFEKNWMSYVIDREIENHPERSKWNVVKLESISELITKGSSPKWQGIQYTEHGILFITSENIGNGKLKIQKKKYVETKFNEIQKHSILKRGDLLTNIVGAGIGKSALFDLDESANINQAVAIIRLNNDIEKKFILNVLQSSQIIQFMHGNKVESARPNLSLTQVRNFPIPLPPADIQKQIIQNIKNSEEKFKSQKKQFENIKNNYDSKINYINHIQSSVLNLVFSGKLVN
jgi:type I restriction enzyme, S subunit